MKGDIFFQISPFPEAVFCAFGGRKPFACIPPPHNWDWSPRNWDWRRRRPEKFSSIKISIFGCCFEPQPWFHRRRMGCWHTGHQHRSLKTLTHLLCAFGGRNEVFFVYGLFQQRFRCLREGGTLFGPPPPPQTHPLPRPPPMGPP